MPAFIAHYTCGELARHQVYGNSYEAYARSEVGRALEEHPGVYHVGLAGPDLFFYSLWEARVKGMKIGRAMHKYRTGQFLRALYREISAFSGRDRQIALSYFTGFLGHYCLDASAHPLVYRLCEDPDEKKALGRHFRYEAAMDVNCCRYYLGRDIRQSHQMGMVRMNHREKLVTARMLTMALRKTYPDARTWMSVPRFYCLLGEYRLITGLLIDPGGFKEWCFLLLEKLTRDYSLLSALFINGNLYGTSRRDWERFERRFRRGEKYLERLLPMLDEALRDQTKEGAFFQAVGSRSYHTGKNSDGRATEIDW